MKKALLLLLIPLIFFSTQLILAVQPYSYSLEVNTDHSVYALGSTVTISGTVLLDSEPVQNQEIGIQITTPVGMYHVNQIKTDENGYFEDIFQLNENSLEGFYTVYVTNGNQIREVTFEVVKNTKTLTINPNKQTYSPSELVAIAGTLYNSETIPNEPIAIQIINANYGPVFLDQVLTNSDGNYIVSFTLPPTSLSGQYRIFVAAKGIYSIEYFEVD